MAGQGKDCLACFFVLAAHSPQLAEAVAAVQAAAAAEEAQLRRGVADSAALGATEAAMEQLNAAIAAAGLGGTS